MKQNYTLGRGQIQFGQFKPGTQIPRGERYFGNTPEFGISAEQENLDHYSSDEGVRKKDESVLLQLDYTGSLTTDHISPENMAIFFLGEASKVTTVAATAVEFSFDEIEQGLSYQLGTSDATPSGVRKVANVTFTGTGATAEAGVDYTVDLELGRITVLEGSEVLTNGTTLAGTYDVEGSTRDRVVSKATTVEGALRFIAKNPAGDQRDYYMPWVKITPNGDFALKSDEWQTLPYTLEILKKGDLEAIYVDGRPYTPAA
ncbi:hypothetical protein NAV33_07245 [Pseudomonas stutzeri]|uniref:phage tail tube protein n=1 Tax=Stutzerimonas stutzeri TaxID=316 RepID=UPI002109DC33|nr:hypothetical protein [Stutzerimonas stutzeri]MCQ4311689.1 hypothetical protein [Stutzerimonas stutzeri]